MQISPLVWIRKQMVEAHINLKFCHRKSNDLFHPV